MEELIIKGTPKFRGKEIPIILGGFGQITDKYFWMEDFT